MEFLNWLKGAKAKAIVVLGSFAMLLGVGASVYSVQAAKQNEVVETKAADDTSTWKLIGTINGTTYTKSAPYASESSVSSNQITCNLAYGDEIQLYYSDSVIVGGSVLNAMQNWPYDTSTKSYPASSSSYFSNDTKAKVYKSGAFVFKFPANYAEYDNKTYGLALDFTPTVVGTWTGSVSRLWFIPAFNWKTYSYSSNELNPSLYYQWSNGKYSNVAWGTSMTTPSGRDGKNYFYWDNVPLTELSQITILFNKNWASDNPPRLDFSASSRLEWYSASDGHQKNVFGAPSDGWYVGDGSNLIMMNSGYYVSSTSYAYIAGSFGGASLPAWEGSPEESTVFNGSSAPFTISVPLIIGDEFTIKHYNALSNTSSSGNGASWSIGDSWKHYDDLTFTIYDDSISASPISSGDVSNYISKSGDNIHVNHAGDVTISLAVAKGTALTLRWSATSTRSFTPSATLPNRVIGTVNGSSSSLHPISWEPATGRYETLCAAIAGDNFRFANGGTKISVSTLTTWDGVSVSTTTPGSSNITINTTTGYYAIGWYYENTTPNTTPTVSPVYFIDRSSYFNNAQLSTVRCAEALCKKITLFTTCDCTAANADHLATLFAACTYSSKTTYMSTYSFKDYDYTEWRNNGKSYSGLTKKTDTNAYAKYQWIQYIGGNTDTPPAGAGSIKAAFAETSPLTLTLWIVLGAGILGMGAIGTAYFVSKKKKRHQA